LKTFFKLFIANTRQFFRDRMALGFTFAFPVVFMVIFGLVFSGAEEFQYDVGLVNDDASPTGAAVAEAFGQIPIFSVTEGELENQLEELENGGFRAVLYIPGGIAESIARGEPVDIELYYDPSQTTSIQIIQPVVREFVNGINQMLTQQPALVRLQEESIQLKELGNIDYLVPGVVAMSIMFLGLFSGLPLIQQREKKILKRLGATPIHRANIIYSQVFLRLLLALAQTAIIIAIAYFLFDVAILGNWLMLLALILLGTLTFVGLGYMVAAFARTEEGAMPVIQLIQFPMLFLSGIFFPVEFLPEFMKPVLNALPLSYLGDGLRQVMVEASPVFSLSTDFLVLGGWLLASLVISVRFFRWE